MPDRPPVFGRKRSKKIGGSVTKRDTSAAYKRQRLAIFEQEALCRYCYNRGQIAAATILDHLIALSIGGTNDRANLVPACQSCNSAKAADEMRFAARGYDVADIALDNAMGEWIRLAINIS